MTHKGGQIALEAIAKASGPHNLELTLGDLMHDTLCHLQGPWSHLNRQEQFALRIDGPSTPSGGSAQGA